jgi:methionyl-tRNA formyltransferase
MTRAIVFAYHNVGYRCLSTLLAHGVSVPLLVTHQDNPNEQIWFRRVADLAREHRIETITPDAADSPALLARIAALRPDFLFSFYYRSMLPAELLALPTRGAFNMHGALLPQYRGRAPINWAVLHGARETGATLHEMTSKPDAGRIVDQQAVPILPNDTAQEVFDKVTVAAELVLDRALPALLSGTAILREQDLRAGHYYGRRRPEDGRIDWHQSAAQIHNLVRAVAPPYPGAFSDTSRGRLRVLRTLIDDAPPIDMIGPAIYAQHDALYAVCGDGRLLRLLDIELDGIALNAGSWRQRFGNSPLLIKHELK